MTQTRSLRILIDAGPFREVSGSDTEDCPSWVPLWSDLPFINFYTDKAYIASAKSQPAFNFSSVGGMVLHVKGKVFDCIKQPPLANLDAYANKFISYENRFPGWRVSCDVGFSLSTYPTGEPGEEALWRTLCWNKGIDFRVPASRESGDSFPEWHHILTSNDTPRNVENALVRSGNGFHERVNNTSPLCVTVKGYLAAVHVQPKLEVSSSCLLEQIVPSSFDRLKIITVWLEPVMFTGSWAAKHFLRIPRSWNGLQSTE